MYMFLLKGFKFLGSFSSMEYQYVKIQGAFNNFSDFFPNNLFLRKIAKLHFTFRIVLYRFNTLSPAVVDAV